MAQIDNDFMGKLVFVEWIDTVSDAGWETKDDVNTKLVKQETLETRRAKMQRTLNES